MTNYQTGISAKQSSVLKTAEVVSHETGHNMGMRHDFGGCKNEGFMSKVQYMSKVTKWSECSKSDFKAHYNWVLNKQGSWCLAEDATACAGVKELNKCDTYGGFKKFF